MRNIIT